jgi:hypothetical protein
MHLDLIDLIGEPLPPGFAVLIMIEGLEGENVIVPRFAVCELEFSNVRGGFDIGQLITWPS